MSVVPLLVKVVGSTGCKAVLSERQGKRKLKHCCKVRQVKEGPRSSGSLLEGLKCGLK